MLCSILSTSRLKRQPPSQAPSRSPSLSPQPKPEPEPRQPLNPSLLPVEILQTIIQNSCESALALSQVNRRLNQVFQDPLIWKRIIEENQVHDVTPFLRSTRSSGATNASSWHQRIPAQHLDDARWLARWALADSRARAASADNNVALRDDPLRLQGWEAELLVVNHPESGAISVRARADNTKWYISTTEQATRFAFMFAYSTTHLDVDGPGRSSRLIVSNTDVPRMLIGACSRLSKVMPEISDNLTREQLPMEAPLWEKYVIACLSLGTISQYLLYALWQRLLYDTTVDGSQPQLAPPLPGDIPMHELMRVGPPFGNGYEMRLPWHESHLSSMTAKDFLQGVEWVGYNCYTMVHGIPSIGPMMWGIQFEFEDSVEESSSKLRLSGGGSDRTGPFSFSGTFDPIEGNFVMVTTSENSLTSWNWTGMLLPFGIVGSGGDAPSLGWFWLFKRPWSRGVTIA